MTLRKNRAQRIHFFLVAVALAAQSINAQSPSEQSASAYGWKITADARTEQIHLAHDKLGTVMDNIQLLLPADGSNTPLHDWKLATDGGSQLTIETARPRTFWRFD